MLVGNGVGVLVGDGVTVGVEVGNGVGVLVGSGVGVLVADGVGVVVLVGNGVGVGLLVGAGMGVVVLIGNGVGVGVWVGVDVGVWVGSGVGTLVGTGVRVGADQPVSSESLDRISSLLKRITAPATSTPNTKAIRTPHPDLPPPGTFRLRRCLRRGALWRRLLRLRRPASTGTSRLRSFLRRAALWRPVLSFRLTRLCSVSVADFLCLGNDCTGLSRLARTASSLPLSPSPIAVCTGTVERSVTNPSVMARYLAGRKTLGASQDLAAKFLRPPGNDLAPAHAHVASDFTLSRLAAPLPDIRQSLVRLIYLLEPLPRLPLPCCGQDDTRGPACGTLA